ncbi:ABC transporter permease [Herbinix luporum]|jgi:putative aldouronate transport system permease protein|uniref:Putative membrane protein n=1 Tax=Herbinix luporum TaxID=1679721 RepID=A0A0K8J485_9FIRM|nr:ABC transporter permease subunit [Herbinix luporum]CUH92292.1 putative membrane protein [Herbinix luporum]
MNKRKPYYIIIAALCFATIISFFLPYLHLPKQNDVEGDGYKIDTAMAALNSNIIKKVAKESGIPKNIVYNTAKNIINGKDRQTIESRLKENEYYIIDILTEKMNEKVAELDEWGSLEKRTYSYFDMIDLSASVIKYLERDIVSAFLVILTLIMTVVLSYISGFVMLFRKKLTSYKVVKILSLINIFMSFVGILSINAIGIGALQVDKFYKENFGIGFLVIAAMNFVILLIAVIGNLHESWAGIVTFKMIMRQKQLMLMTLPFIVYVVVFYFGPLTGWIMAFQNHKPAAGANQMFVAWDKFIYLLTEKDFLLAFRNTLAMSLINLVFSFIFAIGFALLLNEVVNVKGKKLVQTVSYLPHFLSWIIVAAIVKNVLAVDGGILNELLVNWGFIDAPINFFADGKYFWWIVGLAVVWKETGWNSIIYLASITSINPDLYEAASIDGAGRFKKMIHITLPGIKATIFVLLIINLGMVMNSGFEAQLQLKNDLIKNTAEVIDTYVLNKSFFQGADFSIGTAAGIFKSVISILLVSIANRTAKAFDQERLY